MLFEALVVVTLKYIFVSRQVKSAMRELEDEDDAAAAAKAEKETEAELAEFDDAAQRKVTWENDSDYENDNDNEKDADGDNETRHISKQNKAGTEVGTVPTNTDVIKVRPRSPSPDVGGGAKGGTEEVEGLEGVLKIEGEDGLREIERKLKPVDRYALRYLEEVVMPNFDPEEVSVTVWEVVEGQYQVPYISMSTFYSKSRMRSN